MKLTYIILASLTLFSCQQKTTMNNLTYYPFRLKPHSISNNTGKTIGGYLIQGCKIYTTAEIVILSSDQFVFKREEDGITPWEEL